MSYSRVEKAALTGYRRLLSNGEDHRIESGRAHCFSAFQQCLSNGFQKETLIFRQFLIQGKRGEIRRMFGNDYCL